MACTIFSNVTSFSDLLVWPTYCYYNFWLVIFLAMMFLVAWRLYKSEEKREGRGDFLSAAAVSSLAFAIVGILGSLIKDSSGIPMIQTDVLLYLLAIAIPLIIIWIFKKR